MMDAKLVGDVFVPLFFVSGAVASFFLAYRLLQAKKNAVLRLFGQAMMAFGAAFAIWSVVIFTKTNVELITTLGVAPFVVGLLLSLMASVQKLPKASQSALFLGALAYFGGLFVLRLFVFPSTPGFSENGLFYFHAEPAIVAMYIGAFAAALLPAINAVASQLKDKVLRGITRLCFTVLAIGGIVLVTSLDDSLQTINGWVMGLSFITLVVAYAVKKVR